MRSLAIVVIGLASCAVRPTGVASDGGGQDAPATGDAPAGGDAPSAADAPRAPADAAVDAPPPDAPPPPPNGAFADSTGSGATTLGSASPGEFNDGTLGTNGRSCGTCHDPSAGWSFTTAGAMARLTANANDPLFRLNDGAVSPTADPANMQTAYATLLQRGTIRIQLALPANAEFTILSATDPYNNYPTTSQLSPPQISLYRRPLPATNLRFEQFIMWDGREASLDTQANDAIFGHAQRNGSAGTNPIPQQDLDAIVSFESGLYTAQIVDTVAGALDALGATGGLATLVTQQDQSGPVFNLYTAWENLTGTDAVTQRQLSIARGETIFNTRTFTISNVPGAPDDNAATCASCHKTTNIGSSPNDFINLGLDSDANNGTPTLPEYTLMNTTTGDTVVTTDPGRAMTTGKWADIGLFKVVGLRGLVMHPPYFHNGAKATIHDVVDFYNTKFQMELSGQDFTDLEAFLSSL